MKKTKISVCIFLAVAGVGAALVAQSPSPSAAPAHSGDPFAKDKQPQAGLVNEAPYNICFTVEVYALSQDDAAKLLEDNPGGEARHARVLELVGQGKARFETLLSDVTKNGQRTVVEQNDEVRYGTEFNPPQMPGDPSMPTAFQTRNAGDTLEFEPVTSPDHSVCDVNMTLDSVRFHGFSDIHGIAQEPASLAMPQFESRHLTTSMTLITGKTQFLGTLSAPPQFAGAGGGAADTQEVRLVFGRISLVTIDTAASPAQKEDPTLEHQLVFYSLDREAARKILAGDQKADSYYDAVRALADRKQAHLERITVLKTKSGQRAVVQEVDEERNATEYDLHTFDPAVWKPGSVLPGQTKPVELKSYTATGFEIRNTGLILEIEPVADKSIVDINFAPEILRNIGNLQANGVAGIFAPYPVYENNKVTTSLTAPLGGHAFIGTFSPSGDTGVNGKKDTGKVWFGFIRTVYAQP